jgi:hypothetical protein
MTITKPNTTDESTVTEASAPVELITPEQRHTLLEAKAWWQEGDRALDYLAERARLQSRQEQIQALLGALKEETDWTAQQILPLLPLLRGLSANRAINRTLATDSFAQALRRLLFGDDALPARLTEFLGTQRVGEQTASQFLYAAVPETYPLVSPATRAVLSPTLSQRGPALEAAQALYGSEAVLEASAPARSLLLDFARYEAMRRVLAVESFVDVNAILWHAREMPRERSRPGNAPATFATASNSAPPAPIIPAARVREGVAWYGTEPFGDGEDTSKRATESDVLRYLEAFIAAQGFTFPPLVVRDYYVALKTKPFVILSEFQGRGRHG